MIKVTIEGFGTYQIEPLKVNELLRWLSSHQAVNIQENNTVREVKDNAFTGRVLVNG
jgi:hypothetical protein